MTEVHVWIDCQDGSLLQHHAPREAEVDVKHNNNKKKKLILQILNTETNREHHASGAKRL